MAKITNIKRREKMIENTLTKTQLRRKVGCPGYIIDYLRDCGRLPVIRESKGQGYPALYHPDAVQVIEEHLNKRSR